MQMMQYCACKAPLYLIPFIQLDVIKYTVERAKVPSTIILQNSIMYSCHLLILALANRPR